MHDFGNCQKKYSVFKIYFFKFLKIHGNIVLKIFKFWKKCIILEIVEKKYLVLEIKFFKFLKVYGNMILKIFKFWKKCMILEIVEKKLILGFGNLSFSNFEKNGLDIFTLEKFSNFQKYSFGNFEKMHDFGSCQKKILGFENFQILKKMV